MATATYGGGKTFEQALGLPAGAASQRKTAVNPMAAIEARAEQIMERRQITRAKAMVVALQENPKAYKDYLVQNPKLDGAQTRNRTRAQ